MIAAASFGSACDFRGNRIGRITNFNESARRMFTFGRVKLREAWTQDARLPIFAARGDLLLLDAIFHLPNFRAVIGRKSENDDFEKRIVGTKINFVMQLRNERAKFLKKSDADGFQVTCGRIGIILVTLIRAGGDSLKIAIEAHRLWSGGNLPFGRTE